MENYAETAQRLNKDANTLYDHERFATASHLYGLSVECSIKVFMQQPGQDRVPFKHLPELLDDAKRLMSGCRFPRVLSGNPCWFRRQGLCG